MKEGVLLQSEGSCIGLNKKYSGQKHHFSILSTILLITFSFYCRCRLYAQIQSIQENSLAQDIFTIAHRQLKTMSISIFNLIYRYEDTDYSQSLLFALNTFREDYIETLNI